jgi:hypothetical protein
LSRFDIGLFYSKSDVHLQKGIVDWSALCNNPKGLAEGID